MKGLREEITKLGWSKAKFMRLSDLSKQTVDKIDRGEPVRPECLARAQAALARARSEAGSPPREIIANGHS